MSNMHKPAKPNIKVLGRVLKKLLACYPVLAPFTGICILFSALVSAVPSLFIQRVITAIEKWVEVRDWAAASAEIVPILLVMVCMYVLSITSVTVYTQLMA